MPRPGMNQIRACRNSRPRTTRGIFWHPDETGHRTMTHPVKIALQVMGYALSVGSAVILLFGLAELIAGLAWGIGSLADVLLLTLFGLYALPAGAAMLFGGIWAVSSANNEAYDVPTIPSQRVVGITLFLPAAATIFLLMLGYPHY